MMNFAQWIAAIDFAAVLTGLFTGIVVSVAYFLGLAFSVRFIAGISRSLLWFTVSALSRIIVLISAGWVISITIGGAAAISYGFSFLFVRYMATVLACRWPHKEVPTCN